MGANMEQELGDHPYNFTVPTISDTPKFELDSYIANYTGQCRLYPILLVPLLPITSTKEPHNESGRTRFYRLYHIGTHSKFLSTEALKAAVKKAKSGKDVDAYKAAFEALSRVSGEESDATIDMDWIERRSRDNNIETERLENELKGYKNNLIKESIRMGHEELAQHFYEIGALEESARSYNRMREYCTTASHVKTMLLKMMVVAVDRRQWIDLQTAITRLRGIDTRKCEAKLEAAILAAAQGLCYMSTGQYKQAASQFLSTEPILANNFSDVISMNDVATYGTLCAMATMERNEIQLLVLDNASFRTFIETEPHLRRAVKAFCSSKFRQCFEIFEAYKADYMLDIHLSLHVEKLYEMIRLKVMQQYIIPFSVLTIESLRDVFHGSRGSGETSVESEALKDELFRLISSGSIDARLDLENDTLVRPEVDERYLAYQETLQNTQDFVDQAHLELLHMNMMYAGIEVRGSDGMEQKAELAGGHDHHALDLA
ncbi:hypothetical protein KEM54_001406 [Ascosphaera aggregata]|nr:hypothetical protein KEM54_001406 [Ascosphaera aggregata]